MFDYYIIIITLFKILIFKYYLIMKLITLMK